MTTRLNVSPAVQTAVTLASSLVRQADGLVTEEISARYAFEMARSRPQENQNVATDTARYEVQLKQKTWERIQLAKMAERVTGQSIETLREIVDQLTVLIGRHVEIATEIRQRELLSPALKAALDGRTDDEAVEALTKLDEAAADLPTLEKHLAELTTRTEALAGQVAYNDVSAIVTPSIVLAR